MSMKKYKGNKSSVALDLDVSHAVLRTAINNGYEIYVTECGQRLKQYGGDAQHYVSRKDFCMALPINRWFSLLDYCKAWRDEGNQMYNPDAIEKRLKRISDEDGLLLVKKIDAESKKAIYYCSAAAFEKHVIGVKS